MLCSDFFLRMKRLTCLLLLAVPAVAVAAAAGAVTLTPETAEVVIDRKALPAVRFAAGICGDGPCQVPVNQGF